MPTINIRPVTDLRNHYSDVESDVLKGPVFLTKNGYGSSVLVSIQYFQRHMAMEDVYAKIAKAEQEIDTGKGIYARASLRQTRARLHV